MNSKNSHFNVSPSPFFKELHCPSSKSQANRLLILAALDEKDIFLENISKSSDVTTMLTSFEQIGLDIKYENNGVWVKGSFPHCEKETSPLTLKTGDGGTTNRFIIPLLSRGKREYIIEALGHMRNRPMEPLLLALKELGASIEMNGDHFWLKVKGPWKNIPDEISIDCSQSTQFATGLLLASAGTTLKIKTKNVNSSLKYYEMSEHLVESWKSNKINYHVPLDFSSLSYPLALGATLGEVKITNFTNIDHYQPDSSFIEILQKMGAYIETSSQYLHVKKGEDLSAIELDCSGFPDLVPTLAYVCSYAKGHSQLKNLEVLRHKESDRVEEVIKILEAFNVDYKFDYHDHNLHIFGNSERKQAFVSYHPPADHRIVMALYLFMRKNSGGKLYNFHHVKKSYPSFFEDIDET